MITSILDRLGRAGIGVAAVVIVSAMCIPAVVLLVVFGVVGELLHRADFPGVSEGGGDKCD